MNDKTHNLTDIQLPETIKEDKLKKDKKRKGDYILGKTLGEGAFGKVKIATHIHTQQKVAIKILDKSKMIEDEDDVVRVQKEIGILKKLRHNNIIQLYEIMESQKHLYLVMEYCENKELFDYIVKNQRLNEMEACSFYQQILNGLEYLHSLKIVHRDLKPENLLLDYNNTIKISDFGLSTNYDGLLSTPCGTPCYAPPEMLRGDDYNGIKSDIWSTGIILYAMLCGALPYAESKEDVILKKITNKEYMIPEFISPLARDLLMRLLQEEPCKRISFKQIKKHPWFNLLRPSITPGLYFGYHKIPIDENVLALVESYGLNKEITKEHLLSNKYDSYTSIYYLCMKQHIKNGNISISDLKSDDYLRFIDSNCLKNVSLDTFLGIKPFSESLEESIDRKSNSIDSSPNRTKPDYDTIQENLIKSLAADNPIEITDKNIMIEKLDDNLCISPNLNKKTHEDTNFSEIKLVQITQNEEITKAKKTKEIESTKSNKIIDTKPHSNRNNIKATINPSIILSSENNTIMNSTITGITAFKQKNKEEKTTLKNPSFKINKNQLNTNRDQPKKAFNVNVNKKFNTNCNSSNKLSEFENKQNVSGAITIKSSFTNINNANNLSNSNVSNIKNTKLINEKSKIKQVHQKQAMSHQQTNKFKDEKICNEVMININITNQDKNKQLKTSSMTIEKAQYDKSTIGILEYIAKRLMKNSSISSTREILEDRTNSFHSNDEQDKDHSNSNQSYKKYSKSSRDECDFNEVVNLLNKKFLPFFEAQKDNYDNNELYKNEETLTINLEENPLKEENKEKQIKNNNLIRKPKGGIFNSNKNKINLTKTNKTRREINNYYVDNDTDHRYESSVERSNSKSGVRSFSFSPDSKTNFKFDNKKQWNKGIIDINNSKELKKIEVISEDEEIALNNTNNKYKNFKKSIVKNPKIEKRVVINLDNNDGSSIFTSHSAATSTKSAKKPTQLNKPAGSLIRGIINMNNLTVSKNLISNSSSKKNSVQNINTKIQNNLINNDSNSSINNQYLKTSFINQTKGKFTKSEINIGENSKTFTYFSNKDESSLSAIKKDNNSLINTNTIINYKPKIIETSAKFSDKKLPEVSISSNTNNLSNQIKNNFKKPTHRKTPSANELYKNNLNFKPLTFPLSKENRSSIKSYCNLPDYSNSITEFNKNVIHSLKVNFNLNLNLSINRCSDNLKENEYESNRPLFKEDIYCINYNDLHLISGPLDVTCIMKFKENIIEIIMVYLKKNNIQFNFDSSKVRFDCKTEDTTVFVLTLYRTYFNNYIYVKFVPKEYNLYEEDLKISQLNCIFVKENREKFEKYRNMFMLLIQKLKKDS